MIGCDQFLEYPRKIACFRPVRGKRGSMKSAQPVVYVLRERRRPLLVSDDAPVFELDIAGFPLIPVPEYRH